jgi:hypothetical protein
MNQETTYKPQTGDLWALLDDLLEETGAIVTKPAHQSDGEVSFRTGSEVATGLGDIIDDLTQRARDEKYSV